MRLAIINADLALGGAQRVMVMLANHWAAKGMSVSVVTFEPHEAQSLFALHEAITIERLDLIADSGGLPGALRNNRRRIDALTETLTALKPEMVLSFQSETNVLSIMAARRIGLPVVAGECSNPFIWPTKRFWRLARRFAYPRADKVVVQTEAGNDYFRPWLKERSRVIANPLILPAEPAPRHERNIVALGRLSSEKGMDRALHAFAQTSGRAAGWRMTLYGEGPERMALESLRDELGLADCVTFPGFTDGADALRTGSLFVLPSHFEGFPNALVEAMGYGLPPVSFDCPTGPNEIIERDVSGILAPPDDIPALAAGMERLMRDDAERRCMGDRARERVARYDIAVIAREWEELFAAAR